MRYPVHRLAPRRVSLAAPARPCRGAGARGISERRGGSLLRRRANSGPVVELARSVQMSTAVRSASPAYPLPPQGPAVRKSPERSQAATGSKWSLRDTAPAAVAAAGAGLPGPGLVIGLSQLCETPWMSVGGVWWFGVFVGLLAAALFFVGVYALNYRAPRETPPPPREPAPAAPIPLRPAERIRRARAASPAARTSARTRTWKR